MENPDKRDFIAARLRGLADEVLKLKTPRHVVFMENEVQGDPAFKAQITSWVIFMSSDQPIEGIDHPAA